MKTVNIGLLGLGTIGKGVYKAIGSNGDIIAKRTGLRLKIRSVCDKDPSATNFIEQSQSDTKIVNSVNDILKDDEIDVFLELIGGKDPAREIILSAIKAKKHVVTANKALLSEHWEELFKAAVENNVLIKFEASVCGAIPVIKVIQESFVTNNIRAFYGIVNGTANYILTQMGEHGLSFEESLKKAQELGFAESDPTLDINGQDSAHKLSILAFLGYGIKIRPGDIYVEGVENIRPYDLMLAKKWGFSVKLLAIARKTEEGLQLRVHPALVKSSHPISSVKGEDNAVFIDGDLVGSSLLYGKGAGALPTASSVISDIVDVASRSKADPSDPIKLILEQAKDEPQLVKMEDVELSYYLRFSVIDKPGVLAGIADYLAEKGISIASVTQSKRHEGQAVPVVILTHEAKERAVRSAIEKIDQQDYVTDRTLIIRRES